MRAGQGRAVRKGFLEEAPCWTGLKLTRNVSYPVAYGLSRKIEGTSWPEERGVLKECPAKGVGVFWKIIGSVEGVGDKWELHL